MRRFRIDVRCDHIGLDLVAQGCIKTAGVVDGVKHRQQLARLIAITLHRKGDDGPDGGVRVLAAILANAWRVSLNVPRVGH